MPQPTPDGPAMDAFVAAFRAASNHGGDVGHFAFADTPEVQTDLARLVLEDDKRATAGLAADPGEDTPHVGQHDVVLDGTGAPVCLIRTDEIRTLPFASRDPAFAWDEGEDDRTLDAWTDIHVRFFTREAESLGLTFDDDTLVNFERFSVVWPELEPPPLVEHGEVSVRPVRPVDRPWVRTVTAGVISQDGWSTDRCPGLLARGAWDTVGVLVFVPSRERTEVVAVAVLDEADGVEDALPRALVNLRDHHQWGEVAP